MHGRWAGLAVLLARREGNGSPLLYRPTEPDGIAICAARETGLSSDMVPGMAQIGRVPRGGVGTVDPRQDRVQVRRPVLAS